MFISKMWLPTSRTHNVNSYRTLKHKLGGSELNGFYAHYDIANSETHCIFIRMSKNNDVCHMYGMNIFREYRCPTYG